MTATATGQGAIVLGVMAIVILTAVAVTAGMVAEDLAALTSGETSASCAASRCIGEVLEGREVAEELARYGWEVATQAPPLEQVRLREHAVERHGEQALEARRRVFNCAVENFRAKICPPTERYGMRVHFWCVAPGSGLCPGMVCTIGGTEKTSFIKPCSYWENCQ